MSPPLSATAAARQGITELTPPSKTTSGDLLQELHIERAAQHDPTPPRFGPRPVSVGLAVAISASLCLWFWGRTSTVAEVDPVAAADVPGAPTTTAGPTLDASGYVVARRTATVSSQLTGVVTDVLFEEGDHVEQGQVLARLDARSAMAGLESAQRQVAAAGQLARQHEIQFAQALRDSQRALELSESGLMSRQDVEQASAKANELQAQMLSQRRNAQAARALADVAQVNLDHAVIRAPFAGVITSKAAQVGEIISPSAASGYTRTGVATIVDMNSLEVEVDVGEAYIGRVRIGMAADVRLNAYPELPLPGKVIAIIPTADRGKATVKARIGLQLNDPRILPDMGARVSFLVAASNSPDIPSARRQRDSNSAEPLARARPQMTGVTSTPITSQEQQ